MRTKKCFKCKQAKLMTSFYRHPKMSDGHLGKCKLCTRADVSANRKRRSQYYRDYESRRAKSEHRKELARRLARTEAGRRWHRKAQERDRERHPGKYRAHYLTGNAIRDGRLTRGPCAMCGSSKSQAHHTDYRKPLTVVWLCKEHHREAHK